MSSNKKALCASGAAMVVDEPSDDRVWVARCVARFIELDPQLDPELARPVAEDMASRARWRSMSPEVAAQTVFDFGSKPGASGR